MTAKEIESEPSLIEISISKEENSVCAGDFLQVSYNEDFSQHKLEKTSATEPFQMDEIQKYDKICFPLGGLVPQSEGGQNHSTFNRALNVSTDFDQLSDSCVSNSSFYQGVDISESESPPPPPRKKKKWPFKCILCGKAFQKKRNLLRHIKTHGEEKPFECIECGKSFSRNANLKRHTVIHTKVTAPLDEDSLKCEICGKSFKRISNLKKHLKIHEVEKTHKCTICPKSFVSVRDLNHHAFNHTTYKPFSCPFCNLKFRMIQTVKRHMLIKHRKTKLNFDMTTLKRNHMSENLYGPVEPLVEEQNLLAHFMNEEASFSVVNSNEHSQEVLNVSEETDLPLQQEQEPFKCTKCSKSFKQKENLRKHLKTHTEVKPHVCSICDKGFIRPADLKRHTLTHTTIKPFTCILCDISYRQIDTLKRHVLVAHSNDGTF